MKLNCQLRWREQTSEGTHGLGIKRIRMRPLLQNMYFNVADSSDDLQGHSKQINIIMHQDGWTNILLDNPIENIYVSKYNRLKLLSSFNYFGLTFTTARISTHTHDKCEPISVIHSLTSTVASLNFGSGQLNSHCWSLGIDKHLLATLNNGCDHINKYPQPFVDGIYV